MPEEEERLKELVNKKLIHRYLEMFLKLYDYCYVIFCYSVELTFISVLLQITRFIYKSVWERKVNTFLLLEY